MTQFVFFYGTLMSGFNRTTRLGPSLRFVGRGSIPGTLFDLGIYPAAVPASDRRVYGECHQILDPASVLPVLDEIEGYSAAEPDASLYLRAKAPVTLEGGQRLSAWVYFYNAPLGKAERIESRDYLEHMRGK
jgi:gamma-glutamylcyclotransferase (GGCT)/AIG2-like uncharacterized protein YtfP